MNHKKIAALIILILSCSLSYFWGYRTAGTSTANSPETSNSASKNDNAPVTIANDFVNVTDVNNTLDRMKEKFGIKEWSESLNRHYAKPSREGILNLEVFNDGDEENTNLPTGEIKVISLIVPKTSVIEVLKEFGLNNAEYYFENFLSENREKSYGLKSIEIGGILVDVQHWSDYQDRFYDIRFAYFLDEKVKQRYLNLTNNQHLNSFKINTRLEELFKPVKKR